MKAEIIFTEPGGLDASQGAAVELVFDQGADGKNGRDGADGRSAYQIAQQNGFTGSQAEWLASMVGPAGRNGDTPYVGVNGNWWVGTTDTKIKARGDRGENGFAGQYSVFQFSKSASAAAPTDGWLTTPPVVEVSESLWMRIGVVIPPEDTVVSWSEPVRISGSKGDKGDKGDKGEGLDYATMTAEQIASLVGPSAYEVAVGQGFVGTVGQWIASLQGKNGTSGADGKQVELRKSATAIEWRYTEGEWHPLVDLADIVGPAGADGTDGESAYDVAVEQGFVGTVGQWLASLKGTDGSNGADGRPVELQKSGTHIQWRYVGDTVWLNLVALSAIIGPAGNDGADGRDGIDGKDGLSYRPVITRAVLASAGWVLNEVSGLWEYVIAQADITDTAFVDAVVDNDSQQFAYDILPQLAVSTQNRTITVFSYSQPADIAITYTIIQ